ALRPWLAVLDDEARHHLCARRRFPYCVQTDQLGVEAPARDTRAHIAAALAAGVFEVRILRKDGGRVACPAAGRGGDRGADKLARHHRRTFVAEIELEVRDELHVRVAADHYGVGE